MTWPKSENILLSGEEVFNDHHTLWSNLTHNIGGVVLCHIIYFTHNSLQTRGKLYNYVVLDSSFIPVVILWLLTLDIWPLPPPLHVMGEALNTSLDGIMHEALFKLTSQFSRFLLSKLTKQALFQFHLNRIVLTVTACQVPNTAWIIHKIIHLSNHI